MGTLDNTMAATAINTVPTRSFHIKEGERGHSNLEFEDYNTTSKVYDEARVAVGIPTVLQELEKHGIAASSARVLDGGSGTGNALFQLQPHVAHITGFELNPGMLAQSEAKLAKKGDIDNVTFMQGSLLEKLPFDDNTFDLVVCKPGGLLAINHCDPEQSDGRGFWWMDLIPRACVQYKTHLVPTKDLEGFYRDAGFSQAYTIPIAEPLQGNAYFNLTAPFSAQFRQTDSNWAMVTAEELDEALKTLQKKFDDGNVGAWVDSLDKHRREK